MTKSTLSPQELKEKGNEEFLKGNWDDALQYYTNALKLTEENNLEKVIYYKNRAAVYLKQKNYESTIKDCDEALKISPNDPKALFRRCQALHALDRYEEAYRDAHYVINVDPNNKAVRPVLARLYEIVQERQRQNSRTSAKVSQMFELAFDMKTDKEKRRTAMNNLLVLSRETAGAKIMFEEGIVLKISKLLKIEKANDEIIISSTRIIAELCRENVGRTSTIIKKIGLPWFLEMMNSKNEERVNAAQHCIQNGSLAAILSLCGQPRQKILTTILSQYILGYIGGGLIMQFKSSDYIDRYCKTWLFI